MVRKKMEGDEEQRRAAAREAERAGERPSARSATTGASKQRAHLTASADHDEKTESVHRGKQRSAADIRAEPERPPRPSAGPEERSYTGRGAQEYSPAHEQVFQAVAEAEQQHSGEGAHLDEVARIAGLTPVETRALLHDLITTHGLVSELQRVDSPDLGPRYETKPRH